MRDLKYPANIFIWAKSYLNEHGITGDFIRDIETANCWICRETDNEEYYRVEITHIDYKNGAIWFSSITPEVRSGGWWLFKAFKQRYIPVFN